MRKIIDKLLSLPTYFYAGAGALIFFSVLLQMQSGLELKQVITVTAIITLAIMIYAIGSAVIKALLSLFFMLYMNSIVSMGILMVSQDYFVQPFMITILMYSLFLSFTYSTKYVNRGLRSRWVWVSIMIIAYLSLKILLISNLGLSHIVTEAIALVFAFSFIGLWLLWIEKSSKTHIYSPEVIKETSDEDNIFIYLNDDIYATRVKKNKLEYRWAKSRTNAYPWIFTQAILNDDLHKKGTILISKDSNVKDITVKQIGGKKEIVVLINKE